MIAAKATPATPGKVADASVVVPSSTSAKLAASGVVGIIRTLAYKAGASEAGDLTAEELAWHLANGLWVTAYQRVRFPGWAPDHESGMLDAVAAAAEARRIGLPDGVHIWQDLEGCGGTAEGVITYSAAWANSVGLYRAALYVGYQTLLTPEQLYALPHTSYGSDAGHRHVATRGICWQQGAPFVLDGITFDSGEMQADLLGGLPMVASAAA